MTKQKLLLLLLSLIALAALAWQLEWSSKKTKEAELGNLLFPGLKKSELQQINVQTEDNSYGLKRVNAQHWVMEEPTGAATDPLVVDDMLETLCSLRSANTISPNDLSGDLSSVGLSPPLLEVKFTARNQEHQLRFGRQHELSGRHYLQLNNAPLIHLVAGEAFQSFQKKVLEIRDRTPFLFDSTRALKLVIWRKIEGELRFSRSDENADWFLTSAGSSFEADDVLVQELLNEIANLTVKEFIDNNDNDPARYGLNSPLLRVSVNIGAQKTKFPRRVTENPNPYEQQLIISEVNQSQMLAAEGEEYRVERKVFFQVMGQPWLYQSSKTRLSKLRQVAEHFRNRVPFAKFNPDTVQRLTVIAPQLLTTAQDFSVASQQLQLFRQEKALWQISRQGEKERGLDPKYVDDFMSCLAGVEFLTFLAPDEGIKEDTVSAKPLLSIELTAKERARLKLLRLTISPQGVGEAGEQSAVSPAENNVQPRFAQVLLGEGDEGRGIVSAAQVNDLTQCAQRLVRASELSATTGE